ncbi:hypothetical protein [Streptomyces sp. SID3343]|uniref:hypothetical protein n=1 Tax=Streptomyces sp. SID3343 TaxID=2690260 RepID=UPI00137006E1|nr:hypothetical protein [Streptomyces sp. SID3343]MYW04786.1 hypothetical protein [Streptomyces sp. SID3343]
MGNAHRPNANTALRALVDECGCGYATLARAVNAVAAEAGVDLHYGRPSIAQWLGGVRPRDPVPVFLAEALARRLGRPLVVSDIGMAPEGVCAEPGPPWDLDPATALAELGSTVERRRLVTSGAYSLAAVWGLPDWQDIAARGTLAATSPGIRVGASDVEGVRAMTDFLLDLGDVHGSGAVRSTALAFLTGDVAAYLRADASERVRRDLHSSAAMLAYTVGWYHWDSELHVGAQRLYTLALRLAASADDGPAYAIVLRGMSLQARGLGHSQTAAHLAEQAHSAAGGIRAQPRHRAFVLAARAVAAGGQRDTRAALRHLTATEHALQLVDNRAGPGTGFHGAALEHAAALTHRGLGDPTAAAGAMARSNRARPDRERHPRAISGAILAEVLLDLGRLEEACATWTGVLDDAEHLRSARLDTAIILMRARLRPHARVPAAAALLRRATEGHVRP